MAQFHFVEDYERYVDTLCEVHPIDEAMALAVGNGGDYDHIGAIERDLLLHAGLKDGMSVLDIGCGSGRLASALSNTGLTLNYLGIDVVQKLLDYAATKSDQNYKFELNHKLSLPKGNASVDIVCAFSVFTHLLHHESYLYVEDAKRVLRPGGKLIFSFLEFSEPGHWNIFAKTVEAQRRQVLPALNTFIERNSIRVWAEKLGFVVSEFIDGEQAVTGSTHLGQATAILLRRD